MVWEIKKKQQGHEISFYNYSDCVVRKYFIIKVPFQIFIFFYF